MQEQTMPTDAAFDAKISSAGDATRPATTLNHEERKPQWRRKLLAIFALAVIFAGFWTLTTLAQKSIDGLQQQDLTDSGGEDAWLSSVTH
jgi:hypothetical protein